MCSGTEKSPAGLGRLGEALVLLARLARSVVEEKEGAPKSVASRAPKAPGLPRAQRIGVHVTLGHALWLGGRAPDAATAYWHAAQLTGDVGHSSTDPSLAVSRSEPVYMHGLVDGATRRSLTIESAPRANETSSARGGVNEVDLGERALILCVRRRAAAARAPSAASG